jgi:hypothetical protein
MAASAIFKLQTAISPRRADNDHKAASCSPFSVNPGETVAGVTTSRAVLIEVILSFPRHATPRVVGAC